MKLNASGVNEKAVSSLDLCSLYADFSLQVSKYLTSQFYSLNYSLRQRMDILDVSALTSHFPSVAPMLRCNAITFYSSWQKAETGNFLTLLFVSGIPVLFLTLLHSIPQGSLPTECRACVGHLPGQSHSLLSHHRSVLSSLSEGSVVCL